MGQDQPPVTHYRLGNAKTGFYAEFLTPLFGAEHGRDRKAKATRRIAGVVSQQLRYLDVLPLATWTVSLGHSRGFPFEDPRDVRIANPASFLAHKVLIHNKRTRSKFAKDVLYIHDTLEIFGARLEDLNRAWRTEVKPKIHSDAVKNIQRAPADLFGEINDTIRDAARMTEARRLSAEAVRERCSFGLARIFNGN